MPSRLLNSSVLPLLKARSPRSKGQCSESPRQPLDPAAADARGCLCSAAPRLQHVDSTYRGGKTMYRAFGAAALLSLAIAAPVQEAAAQDPVGGALLGGAAGAIVGGALGGGRGAAVGAVVGGVTGAAIAAQGQPRPGGYRYYQQACYQQRGDGAWVAVAPQYCAPAGCGAGRGCPATAASGGAR